jgi:hypothetical protein
MYADYFYAFKPFVWLLSQLDCAVWHLLVALCG